MLVGKGKILKLNLLVAVKEARGNLKKKKEKKRNKRFA